MIPFAHRIVSSYTSSDQRSLVWRDGVHTYGVHETEPADTWPQWDALCRQSPASLAVYTPMPGGSYERLYSRAGVPVAAFANFCAVYTRFGWQVLQPPANAWRPREQAERCLPEDDLPALQDAPERLPKDTPLLRSGTTWQSLFASFLAGGGVTWSQLFVPERLPLQGQALERLAQDARFVQRQDLIYQHRYGHMNRFGGETFGLSPRDEIFLESLESHALPASGPRLSADDISSLSAEAQVGLLRSITSAHLAVYLPTKSHRVFVKTHERFGAPRGRTDNLAVACTATGWMPLPNAFIFQEAASSSALDVFQIRDVEDGGRRFKTLFDAFLLGGGVWFEVPELLPIDEQREHVTKQVDAFIWRWRSVVRLQSEAQASAWGKGFRASVNSTLTAASDAATRALATSESVAQTESIEDDEEVPLAQRGWFRLTSDSLGRVGVRPFASEAATRRYTFFVADFEGEANGQDFPRHSSPRPPARRLTWPGLVQSPPGSPEPLTPAVPAAMEG